MLKFSTTNRKLAKLAKVIKPALKTIGNYTKKPKVVSFSKLSGHCCPFADKCKSMAIDVDGKRHIEDGPNTEFRCFSASQEALFPVVYNARKNNWDLMASLKSKKQIADQIMIALPDCDVCRIHVGADFQRQMEFDAWCEIARLYPKRIFYAYTKSLPFWVKRLNSIPHNLVLTASRGGKKDKLIDQHNLREAKVYLYTNQVPNGIEIDQDDSHAADIRKKDTSFALLIHGIQPAGTEAAKAVRA